MAEVKKVVIAELDIKVDVVIEKQKQLTIEIEKQKAIQNEYKKAVKDSGQATEDQTDAYIKSQATLNNLNKEYKQNTTLIQNSEKATKSELGSREQLQAQLSTMTIAWSKLSQEQRENSEEGKQLSKQILDTTNALKGMESGVGNNFRNVGNYKDALRGVETELKAVEKALKDQTKGQNFDAEKTQELIVQKQLLQKEYALIKVEAEQNGVKFKENGTIILTYKDIIKNTKTELQNVEKAIKEQSKAKVFDAEKTQELIERKKGLTSELKSLKEVGDGTGGMFGNLGQKMKGSGDLMQGMGGPIGSLTGGMKGVIVQMWAMVANPLGAILAAIAIVMGVVVKVFSTFTPVIDAIEQGMSALKAVWDTLVGGFFSWISGSKDFNESFGDMGSKMSTAASEAIKLQKSIQDLADAQSGQNVRNSEAKTKIDELILQSKNRTLTEQQRIDLIDKAQKIEEDNFKQKEAMANKEVENSTKALAIKLGLNEEETKRLQKEGLDYARTIEDKGKNADDEIKKLEEALVSKQGILQESISLQEKAQNREDKLQEDKEAKEAKAQEDAKKRQADFNANLVRMLDFQVTYFKATNESKIKDNERLTQDLVVGEIARIDKLQELETKANDKAFKLGLKNKEDYKLAKIQIEKSYNDELEVLAQKQLDQSIKDLDISIREYNLANQSKLKGAKELTNELVAEETLRLEKQRKFAEDQASLEIKDLEILAIKRKEIKAASDAEIVALQVEFQAQQDAKRKESLAIETQAEFELKQQNTASQFDQERNALDEKHAKDIEAAKKVGANITAIEQTYSNQRKAIKKAELQAQLALAATVFGNMAELFGKGTKAGKVAASAQTAISTVQGAMGAFAQGMSTFPAPYGAIVGGIAAGVVGLQGAKSIKDIWAVKETGETNAPTTPTGSVNIETPTGSAAPKAPTNFDGGFAANQVGGSSGTTQIVQQPVLIIDEVTHRQMQQGKINQVATL